MAWCGGRVLSGRCWEPVLNGTPDRCFYHEKIDAGLIRPSVGSLYPPGWSPANRPELERGDDGWLSLTGPEPDLIDQLMGWDEKQLRAFEARH